MFWGVLRAPQTPRERLCCGGLRPRRRLTGGLSLRWADVVAVVPSDGSVTLQGKDGRTLVIATTRFEPDERVRLERTIARRVKEAAR